MASKLEKRLKSLDAMRGVGIPGTLPFHLFFFGGFFALLSGQGTVILSQSFPPPIDFGTPLGTGLILFFFITGVSLAVSLGKGCAKKNFFTVWRQVIIRYGGYYLLSFLLEIILWYSLQGTQLNLGSAVLFIVGGLPSSFSGPIQGLSLAAVMALPLIFYFSWKKLAVISLGSALAVGSILYYLFFSHFPFQSPSLLNPLLVGYFSALKGISILLAGAVVGKLVIEGRDIKKKMIITGIVITAAYMVIPTLLGSGFIHMLLMIWAYPYAISFILGSSFFLFGLFQILEDRKVNLGPFQVIGRLSVLAYFGHFLILLPIIQLIGGFANASMGLLLILMIISEIIVWITAYIFSKRRWGNPSNW